MNKEILLVSSLLFVSGCTTTVWVTEKKTVDGKVSYESVGGVPFYVKKEVLDQKTIYSKSWLKSTLSVEKKLMYTKNGEPASFSVDKQNYEKHLAKHRLSDLNAIKKKIIQAGTITDNEVKDLVSEYADIASDIDISNSTPELIGNTVKINWVVNGSKKYYLNSPLPWFGAGNLTQELNFDGTLSKVVSNPDTKLAEGISSLIPFKEFFIGKYVDPLSDDSDVDVLEEVSAVESLAKSVTPRNVAAVKTDSKIVYIVSLAIDEIGYLYIFTETHDDSSTIAGPLPFDLVTGKFSRTNLGVAKPAEKKKEEGKTVGLSGSISFPKGWGESK